MKENRVIRVDSMDNDSTDIDDLNEILREGWLVQNVMPVGSGIMVYVLVRELNELELDAIGSVMKDYERLGKDHDRLKQEAETVTRQLHTALEDMDNEYRRKYFLWRFIKEAYERSKANDNKWWAKASCYFKVSRFPEIFETYDVNDAAEIIQKFYTEEDEYNVKEQSSENQSSQP